ncbi:Polygalacturonase 1 [Phytophthora boehmeriae]|uniref:endo-polygalacturonase n=1 Tax=Phytophthora boehmeriae TaxID=109152 RepID=A0A8T1WWP7_9STRA|nr:Polygalacturonase 1 [Phytophthora boehmeriae]
MKLVSTVFAAIVSLAIGADGSAMLREAGDPCHLTGTYRAGADISSCSSVTIGPLSVPAGVTLDLSKAKSGATIEFTGTTTFGTQKWEGPLVWLSGNSLTVKGSGTLDGQGPWYWEQGESITRPVFFRMQSVTGSNISGFTVKNSPFRTFSIVTCIETTISGLTLDSKAGDNRAKNTDGFDLTKNDHVTITGNKIFNQDDCLAMQSSTNTIFSNNLCSGGHGISVGSLGGSIVDASTTVSGLTVQGNAIADSTNGLRIKAVSGQRGLVSKIKYIDNTLSNVDDAIVIRSNYNRGMGAYSGGPTSLVTITDVTISGLSGTAKNLYDIIVNPSAVSIWNFSGITVKASTQGSCSGQPSSVSCK